MKTTPSSSRPPHARQHRAMPAPSRDHSTLRDVKLVLVDFRSGEAVRKHPELQPWLNAHWTVRSAMPRIVEHGETKLLVVLERSPFGTDVLSPTASSAALRPS